MNDLLPITAWLLLSAATAVPPAPTFAGSVPDAVRVTASDFSFDMPARVQGGVIGFVFENRGREPHYVRFMRLGAGKGREDVVEWRKNRSPAPPWLTPAGGLGTIAPGITSQAHVRLQPGRYVALCGHPSPDGTPHVDKGMISEFEVTGPMSDVVPPSTRALELRDHVLALDAPSRAATETWHVVNRSAHAHQALLVRLPAGVAADAELAWFRGGSRGHRPGRPAGGLIELAPGEEGWFTTVLAPGHYLLMCGVVSPSGERHFDLGMSRTFEVR